MKKVTIYLLIGVLSLGSILTSCEAVQKYTNKTQRGAAIGAVAGGVSRSCFR